MLVFFRNNYGSLFLVSILFALFGSLTHYFIHKKASIKALALVSSWGMYLLQILATIFICVFRGRTSDWPYVLSEQLLFLYTIFIFFGGNLFVQNLLLWVLGLGVYLACSLRGPHGPPCPEVGHAWTPLVTFHVLLVIWDRTSKNA